MRLNFNIKPIFLLLIIAILTNCESAQEIDIEEDVKDNNTTYVFVSSSTLSFDAEMSSKRFDIESNGTWEITGVNEWCKVSPRYGSNDANVVVSVTDNTQDKDRSVILSITYNNGCTNICISQKKREFLGDGIAHEYVDLGLSVNWAKCNLGANNPEEYGDYFAWGESTPKTSYTSNSSYTYEKDFGDIAGTSLDAATVNWGKMWRMPKLEEVDELINKCEWEWTTLNGINGMIVTGPSGNSIFLPAGGFRWDTSNYNLGLNGSYWSSHPYYIVSGSSVYRIYSFALEFNYIPYTWYKERGLSERWAGLNIRAVRSKS